MIYIFTEFNEQENNLKCFKKRNTVQTVQVTVVITVAITGLLTESITEAIAGSLTDSITGPFKDSIKYTIKSSNTDCPMTDSLTRKITGISIQYFFKISIYICVFWLDRDKMYV